MSARSPRMLLLVCAALALAAAALWGATALTWVRVDPPGRAPVELSGALLVPALTGVALLALAAIAGVVALSGVPRRLVGLLLAAAAVGVAVLVLPVVAGDPVAGAGAAVLPTGTPVSDLVGLPASATPAPALAGAGALVLLAAGLLVLLREPRLPRFGARYASGGPSRAAADPDRRAWDDLDEGRDPTVGTHPAPGSGRVDDP